MCLGIWENTVKEVFLNFIEVERITGKVLGNSILNWLKSHGLSLSNMRDQCYDGASNMTRARSGCRAVLNHQAPLALYFHCAAHRLNMAIVSGCTIQAFKNTESYLGEIAKFFSFSAKRQRLLDKAINSKKSITSTRAKKLKNSCRTRWVECIEFYSVFLELLPAIDQTLKAMVHLALHAELGTDWNWDGDTITKANGFFFQLNSSSF